MGPTLRDNRRIKVASRFTSPKDWEQLTIDSGLKQLTAHLTGKITGSGLFVQLHLHGVLMVAE